eukprot:GFUD01024187.1.p1 GENE.GFUD01024187.1~~GFUD01024187.1.p1  ORF type:complete len:836 (+),score=195.53 GFUD01024187.1:63-2570(+)
MCAYYQSDDIELQASENCHLKHLNVDPDHLFRHLTEVNGKDTRGGYIEGQLEFADKLLQNSFGLKISLIGDKRSSTNKRVHPNLLYMTRFEGKARQRELEARAPMWKIDLEIKDGVVSWWTESEAQALYKQEICKLKINEETNRRSILDLRDLHLTVITPLVRTNVNGIRVRDGLAMRKPLFDDDIFEDHEWEDILKKLDKFFTGKEGKSEMDRICLQFDFHRISGGNEELKPMCEALVSNPIVNSKSRNLGILELYPDTISAQKACCKYGRTIYLPSKFKLPSSEKDAHPRFVVQFHNDSFTTDERIRQPEDVKIFASQIFVFKTPVQDEESIRQIYLAGGKIFIEAYRPKDKQSSSVKFEFEFKVHNNLGNSSIEWCSFCLENPDKIGQTMEESLKQRLSTSGVAKPGRKRRKRDTSSTEGQNISVGSPNSSQPSPSSFSGGSPYSIVSEDQQQLMEDIGEYVITGNDLDDIDIDDLLHANDLPDVLRGVIKECPGERMTPPAELDHAGPAPGLFNPVVGYQLSPSPDHMSLARCLSPSSPPGANARTFNYTDRSASYESDLCETDHQEATSMLSWPDKELLIKRQEIPDSPPTQMSRSVIEISEISLGNYVEDVEKKIQQPTKAMSLISRINNLSPNIKLSKVDSTLGNFDKDEKKEMEQPTNLFKTDSIQAKVAPGSTMSLIHRLNKVAKQDLSTDLLEDDDSAYRSQESVFNIKADKTENGGFQFMPESEGEPKVMEITKIFGGAKQKCIDKMKSKMSKSESKRKLAIKQDLADCFPAIIYILTPFLVMIVATIMNFFWSKYFGLKAEDSVEESFNLEAETTFEHLVNEE